MKIIISLRFWLAGPATFLLTILVMLGMAVWFPKGRAGINHIVLPLVFFPFLWALLFFYAYLASRLKQVSFVYAFLAFIHALILFWHFQR